MGFRSGLVPRPRGVRSSAAIAQIHSDDNTEVEQLVYTDGACSGNPGPGGWAWVEPGGRWANGAEAASTNQRMELKAALEAIRSHPGDLIVVSDSTYVINCFRDGWWRKWQSNGWRNSKKEPVANRELWEPLIAEFNGRGDVQFRWVKGHSDDPLNDAADRLAVAAAVDQVEGSGDTLPPLGPADRIVYRR